MDTAPFNALSTGTRSQGDPLALDVGDWALLGASERSRRFEQELGRKGVRFGRAAALASKRLIDVVGSLASLILLTPLLLAVAVAIRLDSPGPVLFRQRRLGRLGKAFWIYKFRTMRTDAEARLGDLETRNEAAEGVLFKMSNDPRVTRIGQFLRRSNVDELPQLWNVVRGEMSLVGPRPFQLRDCERLKAVDGNAFMRRLEFPPGLTGAWQVGRSSPTDSERLLELDLQYVDHWSLALDLTLICKTVRLLLRNLVD